MAPSTRWVLLPSHGISCNLISNLPLADRPTEIEEMEIDDSQKSDTNHPARDVSC